MLANKRGRPAIVARVVECNTTIFVYRTRLVGVWDGHKAALVFEDQHPCRDLGLMQHESCNGLDYETLTQNS